MYPPVPVDDVGANAVLGADSEPAVLAVEKSGPIAAGGANGFAFSAPTESITSGVGGLIAAIAGVSVGRVYPTDGVLPVDSGTVELADRDATGGAYPDIGGGVIVVDGVLNPLTGGA